MSANTPDRAALAERTYPCPDCRGKGERERSCPYCGDSTFDHECPGPVPCERCGSTGRVPDRRAALAAPAVPPSVAEAREAAWIAAGAHAIAYARLREEAKANARRGASASAAGRVNVAGEQCDKARKDASVAFDALIAAVRAATVAEAVRVVAGVRGGMVTPFAIRRDDALAALRALADAPATPAVPDDVMQAAERWHDVTWESPIIENSSRVELAEDFRTLAAFVRGLP